MDVTWGELALTTLKFLPSLIAAMVIVLVGLWVGAWAGKLVRRMLERRDKDASLTSLLSKITQWSVIGLAVTMALQQVGFNLTAFLTGLGVLGFTVGFALQDVSKNLMAGILLMLQEPLSVGEAVEVNGFSGIVEEIGLRATALRTFDGRLAFLPNADVYTSPIVNFSRTKARRLEVTVGVAYGTDLAQAKETALQAVAAVDGVKDDPAPLAVFHTFNDSSMDMTVYFWVDMASPTDLRAMKDAAVRAVYDAFNQAEIDIPYPIRTVFLEGHAEAA